MRGHEFVELTTFVAVATHRSFSKAAQDLGVSAATVSQTIRSLETKLGVRLLNRTTRSVAVTDAGEDFLARLQPALQSVGEAVQTVNAFRDKPMGSLRIKVARVAAVTLISPLLARFIEENPDIHVEVAVDDVGMDIVKERFDAGIHVAAMVDQDMVAVRLTDEYRMTAAASPGFVSHHGAPTLPRDLIGRPSVRFRLPWNGMVHRWSFSRGEDHTEITVDGPLIVNDIGLAVRAALDGVGIVYLPETWLAPLFADGRLVRLLPEWSHMVPGIYLYYPSKRQLPHATRAFIDFVRANLPQHPRIDRQMPVKSVA